VRPDGSTGPGPFSIVFWTGTANSSSRGTTGPFRGAGSEGWASVSPAPSSAFKGAASRGSAGVTAGPAVSAAPPPLGARGPPAEASGSSSSLPAFGQCSEVSHVGSGLAAARPRPPAVGRRIKPFRRLSSEASTRAVWSATLTPRSPRSVISLAELTPRLCANSRTGILPSGKNLTPSSDPARRGHQTAAARSRLAQPSAPGPEAPRSRCRRPPWPTRQRPRRARALPELSPVSSP
jgi:hypothetical protein